LYLPVQQELLQLLHNEANKRRPWMFIVPLFLIAPTHTAADSVAFFIVLSVAQQSF
jgi:hypothetical protein